MIEVEVKVRINNREKLVTDLLGEGFIRQSVITEKDTYFNSVDRDFRKSDEALRIRTTTLEDLSQTSSVTYKGPKLDSISMSRKEIELQISDEAPMTEIFESLRLTPVFPVIKTRETYIRNNMHALVDCVKDLGDYLELEILVGDIEDKPSALKEIIGVLNSLGYEENDIITTSYLSMLEYKYNSREFWNTILENCERSSIVVDSWLDDFLSVIDECDLPILDLGCGSGNDTLFLVNRGKKVVAADQSENAIRNIVKNFPEVKEAVVLNMLDSDAFKLIKDNSFGIVIADLSLHYFSLKDTRRILSEIRRILVPDGHLLIRVNSINDVNYGASEGVMKEHHLYLSSDGMLKRFFDEDDIRTIFEEFEILFLEEQTMLRYKAPKVLFVASMKNKG